VEKKKMEEYEIIKEIGKGQISRYNNLIKIVLY
jgi:hypothetical protein